MYPHASRDGTDPRHRGAFFKARDPHALAAWYGDHLGVPIEPGQTYGTLTTGDTEAQTVWSAFPTETRYFGPGPASFMLNYRVADLDAMPSQLRATGAEVDERGESYEYGRFGWATDPEGNRFELWEPPASWPHRRLLAGRLR